MYILIQTVDNYDFLTGTDNGIKNKFLGIFESFDVIYKMLKERLSDNIRFEKTDNEIFHVYVKDIAKNFGTFHYIVMPYQMNTLFNSISIREGAEFEPSENIDFNFDV